MINLSYIHLIDTELIKEVLRVSSIPRRCSVGHRVRGGRTRPVTVG